MNHFKRDNQKGFTIVELVVVIIILGILAATALPRFIDVSAEAHLAAVDGVEGGFRAGVALNQAKWLAASRPTNTTTLDGTTIWFSDTNEGWIVGTDNQTLVWSDCEAIWAALMPNAPDVDDTEVADAAAAISAYDGTVDWFGDLTDPTCTYFYGASGVAAGAVPSIAYDTDTGVITRTN